MSYDLDTMPLDEEGLATLEAISIGLTTGWPKLSPDT